ncbi:hypothetical protein RKE29_15785 [Streptomyces sp. B1866]|uniref:hypothetical protein n=1 Tax=Streptomyces sp. B1866 TaxID=3075431 RepID=UPI00288D5ADA|nr:hypothetical protein [Streptomyces sp. B1866]MDT3398085.1 hypothetical protein [Streptomyces sp. B1866]
MPQRDAAERSEGWLEEAYSTKPPICLPCVATALRHCPHLTRPVAVRVRKPRPRAVLGDFFVPDSSGRLVRAGGGHLPYGHRDRAWFLASQLVLELCRCTVVDLGPELGT